MCTPSCVLLRSGGAGHWGSRVLSRHNHLRLLTTPPQGLLAGLVCRWPASHLLCTSRQCCHEVCVSANLEPHSVSLPPGASLRPAA
jgi:hypothetical protein